MDDIISYISIFSPQEVSLMKQSLFTTRGRQQDVPLMNVFKVALEGKVQKLEVIHCHVWSCLLQKCYYPCFPKSRLPCVLSGASSWQTAHFLR